MSIPIYHLVNFQEIPFILKRLSQTILQIASVDFVRLHSKRNHSKVQPYTSRNILNTIYVVINVTKCDFAKKAQSQTTNINKKV